MTTKEKNLSTQDHSLGDVRKAVESIAVNPRAGRLTLLTRKLFNILLQRAQTQGMSRDIYRMPLSEICAIAEFDSNDTGLVKDHLRKMNACQVEWLSTGMAGRVWGVSNLIASAEIVEDRGATATFVEWSYAPNIKERILNPDIYTRISLQLQASLRTSSALALFEICTRYATSPTGLTMREPWRWWRPRLTGQPDSEGECYAEYKYFKRDILKSSLIEINQVTDLQVELIEHKIGRSVGEIQFRVEQKKQKSLQLSEKNLFDTTLLGRILALGFRQDEAESIYASTDEALLKATLDLTEKRVRQVGAEPLGNPSAYFTQALKKRWATKTPVASLPTTEKSQTAKKQQNAISKEVVRDKLMLSRKTQASEYLAELPENDRKDVLARFETIVLPSLGATVVADWKKRGTTGKLAASSFFHWLAVETWGEPTEGDLLEFMLTNPVA